MPFNFLSFDAKHFLQYFQIFQFQSVLAWKMTNAGYGEGLKKKPFCPEREAESISLTTVSDAKSNEIPQHAISQYIG